jgi:hypothetical protein
MIRQEALLVIAIAGFLGGCATAKPIPLPNGQQGYSIEDCDSVSECYKKAGAVCGGPYDVVDQSGETITTVSGSAGVVNALSIPQYAMMIQCKK